MFHRLRLRLMLVNLSVIFILFAFLIAGAYYFAQGKMSHGRELMMKRLARDVIIGDIQRPPGPPDGLGPILFYARVSHAQEIIDISPYVPLSYKQLSQAVALAQNSDPGEIINIDNQAELAFHKELFPDYGGVLFVFSDCRRDRETLQLLVTALGASGLVCMLLSLLGSYFMANKAMAPIQLAWQQQRDFVADASHELRTPLTVIQTNLDVIRDAPEEPVSSQMHWLNNISAEIQQMTKLVEALLFLSRADAYQQVLQKHRFALDEAVLATLESFRPVAVAKGIVLLSQVESGLAFYGDESKLRQTLGILLDNAIRHTQERGEIAVKLEHLNQGIVLSVADTGDGIAPEDLEKIWLRFYQSDYSRSKGGAGLGLAIAKWIIESHEGTVKVKSSPGHGSVFTIYLPCTDGAA